MRALTELVLARAEADATTPRAAAHTIAEQRLPVITRRFGAHRRA
jgi:glutamate dehydrogenase (NAD(P)+)